MKILIDIPEETVNYIRKYTSFTNTAMGIALSSIVHGIPISDNATNGDVIKAMFPNGKVIERDEATGYEQMLDDKCSYCSWFDGLWWNSPYKADKEDD